MLVVDMQTIASPTALVARAMVYEDASDKKTAAANLRGIFFDIVSGTALGNTAAVRIMKAGYPWACTNPQMT